MQNLFTYVWPQFIWKIQTDWMRRNQTITIQVFNSSWNFDTHVDTMSYQQQGLPNSTAGHRKKQLLQRHCHYELKPQPPSLHWTKCQLMWSICWVPVPSLDTWHDNIHWELKNMLAPTITARRQWRFICNIFVLVHLDENMTFFIHFG